jgi:Kef-type K+ transport system membrane component KefB
MDDISGISFMALLFTAIPILRNGARATLLPVLTKELGLFLLKLFGFGALCVLFSRFVERRVTGFLKKLEPAACCRILVVIGFGFLISALAGLIGFSVAIGAFFAGLVFSRDPEAVRLDTPFTILYDLFTPFFFINIGLSIDPSTLTVAFGWGAVLLAVAAIGKIIGNGGPALIMTGWSGALLLAISMIPRAEIAMVIMQRGLALGDWAVPNQVFSAMIVASLATAIGAPMLLRLLLRRWPQTKS